MEPENFMYMGRAERLSCQHIFTRRYLNIGQNSERFYRYLNGEYVEISRAAALDHVRG